MCEKIRCSWAGDLPIYVEYHDQEWGRPVHEDNKLFEMLILEGMQAGLSWITVLKKRKAFREACYLHAQDAPTLGRDTQHISEGHLPRNI